MYNLLSTKLLLTAKSLLTNSCTVLYKVLNMHLWQVLLAGHSGSLIGYVSVTFVGAPGSNVANNLDGAYLGLFTPTRDSSLLTFSLVPVFAPISVLV